MPRPNIDDLVERRYAEAADASSVRLVDLEIVVYAEDAGGDRTGEVVAAAGGLWDRRQRSIVGPARAVRALSAHPGQLESLRWFMAWLLAHVAGEQPPGPRIHAVLLAGGVRGGKTFNALIFAIMYALAIPGAIVWIISPSRPRQEELEAALRKLLPTEWYTHLAAPHHSWAVVNGSRIVLRSAHDPDALKVGDADLVILNEGQQLPERAYTTARSRTAAAGGLVVVAANPPNGRRRGEWVGTFAAEAKAGRRAAKLFELDPFDNPHVDRETLRSIQQEVDEHTFDVEIRGVFRSAPDSVFFNWSRTENEMPTPSTGEITREFLRAIEGHEFDRAVGVDVQRVPHMTSLEMRFFVNPAAAGAAERLEWCLAWFTADVTIEAATEQDLAQAWLDLGWDPARTLLVVDASADWQFSERDPLRVQKMRELVSGRGSADVFRAAGFRYIVKPDRNQERNPDIIERCRCMTSRICTAAPGPFGQRFLFADPSLKELSKAIRSWPAEHGKPSRRSKYAHRCDAASYLMSRFFPRRRHHDPEIRIVGGRPAGQRKREEMAPW